MCYLIQNFLLSSLLFYDVIALYFDIDGFDIGCGVEDDAADHGLSPKTRPYSKQLLF